MKRSLAALAARNHWSKKTKPEDTDEIEVVKILKQSTSPIHLISCRSASASQNDDTIDLEKIIGDPNLMETFQFNFNIDVEFFLTLVDDKMLIQRRPITFISGTPILDSLSPEAKQFNLQEVVVSLPRFGSHHTKMMINFIGHDTMEIIIMTANLTRLDFGGLTQMMWSSGHLKKGKTQTSQGKLFANDLRKYLHCYSDRRIKKLAERLDDFDFLEVHVELVASVPGCYSIVEEHDQNIYGYGSLLQVLKRNNLLLGAQDKEYKVLAEVSSIAYPINTKGEDTSNIFTHLLCPLVFSKDEPFKLIFPGMRSSQTHQKKYNYRPQIIYPTTGEVASSTMGFLSGQALHLSYKSPPVAERQYKQNIRPYLCHWNSTPADAGSTGRENVSPHVKLYAMDNGDNWKLLKWILMGSHNLSKQAWGSHKGAKFINNDPTNYNVLSYELGVLCFSQDKTLVPVYGRNIKSSNTTPIRLPFRVPPIPYSDSDVPWSQQNDLGGLQDSQGISYNTLTQRGI